MSLSVTLDFIYTKSITGDKSIALHINKKFSIQFTTNNFLSRQEIVKSIKISL